MFGYVRLFKPEIKMGEYEQYKGIYCTLCKRLGKHYGLLSRFTLSYDMTFLALLEMALASEGADFAPSRCSFNPTKRCLKACNTAAIDRAADVGTLLTYYKLKDTLADEGFGKKLGALCALPFAAAARKKAAKRQPDTDRAVAAMMTAQTALEAERCPSIDRAAEPFALLLQALAGGIAADETGRRVLERFGYCLGRSGGGLGKGAVQPLSAVPQDYRPVGADRPAAVRGGIPKRLSGGVYRRLQPTGYPPL